ncbi:MAG: hypothetical protein R6U10_07215 [Thermoplasmatota archaeon]
MTVPLYQRKQFKVEQEWRPYRRALGQSDQEMYDRLMHKARQHASAGHEAARLNHMESVFMSMLIEMQKEIEELKKRERIVDI